MEEKDAREGEEESEGERESVEWKRRMQGKGKKIQQGRWRGWDGREGCKGKERRVSRGGGEGGMEEKAAREDEEESAKEMERVEWTRRMQGKGKKSRQGRRRG